MHRQPEEVEVLMHRHGAASLQDMCSASISEPQRGPEVDGGMISHAAHAREAAISVLSRGLAPGSVLPEQALPEQAEE